MISVEVLIGELLLRHNCVIIPGFGGFVAKQIPAVIDYQLGNIVPPSKSLLFNRQLINNDGLLIAELAVKNDLNYTTAMNEVGQLVEDWNLQLQSGSRISIDKVGFLFYDQERNICFEQDRFFNLLLESYGLSKVHFLTEADVQLTQKTIIEKTVAIESGEKLAPIIAFSTDKKETEQTPIIVHPEVKKHTKVWRYVAAACLLPIGFYSFWIPMKTNVLESGMLSIKDFNPFYKSQVGTYSSNPFGTFPTFEKIKTLDETVAELPSDVHVFSYEFDEDLFIPVRVDQQTVEIPETEPIEIKEKPVNSKTRSKFEYIVGCFGSEENATNLVQSLKQKGIDAYIFDTKNGLRRISAGNASTQAELDQLISEVKVQGFEGWALEK